MHNTVCFLAFLKWDAFDISVRIYSLLIIYYLFVLPIYYSLFTNVVNYV